MHVEWAVVLLSNTVVYPWTMMVITFDTAIADVAMTTSRHSDDLTERAKTLSIECLQQVYELY